MYKIHVQTDTNGFRHDRFESVMVGFARHIFNDAKPVENSAHMGVYGEAIYPKRVGKDAAG